VLSMLRRGPAPAGLSLPAEHELGGQSLDRLLRALWGETARRSPQVPRLVGLTEEALQRLRADGLAR
jgi:hypothetical protein